VYLYPEWHYEIVAEEMSMVRFLVGIYGESARRVALLALEYGLPGRGMWGTQQISGGVVIPEPLDDDYPSDEYDDMWMD
jgi:hypothetical protein